MLNGTTQGTRLLAVCMKVFRRTASGSCRFALSCALIFSFSSWALADSFDERLRIADGERVAGKYSAALENLSVAEDLADSARQRALAIGKQAEILADNLSQYQAAREQAVRARNIEGHGPTAEVIALVVLARCEMRETKDYDKAIEHLLLARTVPSTDWAQPNISLMLGDSYRANKDPFRAIDSYREAAHAGKVPRGLAAVAHLNLGLVFLYDLQQYHHAEFHLGEAKHLNPALSEAIRSHLAKVPNLTRPVVLAHYMPWFVADAEQGKWGWHWSMNHFDPNRLSNGRREIASHHYPLIGPYDGNDAAVLEYHLLTMKLAHIDGVIVDWYGLSDYRDYPTLHRTTQALVRQAQQFGMQVAICYEDQTVKARETAGLLEPDELVDVARSEIQWLDKHWFNQSHYVKVDGSPVLLSFGHAGLSKEQWSECLAPFDGRLIYFSQDYRRDAAVGGFAWPNPSKGVNSLAKFVEESQQWRSSIPCAFPRFQDIYKEATVSEGYDRIPDEDGETFATTWRIALDAEAPIIQLVTWNDWGEGTQIEPSQEFGYRDLEVVQRTLNRWTTHERQFKPEDLRLPHRLYLSRKRGLDSDRADAIAKLIVEGNLQSALALLDATADQTP